MKQNLQQILENKKITEEVFLSRLTKNKKIEEVLNACSILEIDVKQPLIVQAIDSHYSSNCFNSRYGNYRTNSVLDIDKIKETVKKIGVLPSMKWLREQIKNYPCEQRSYLSTNDKKEETIRFETLFKEYDFVTKADEDTRNQFAKENEDAINRTVIEMFDSYKFDDIKNLNILFKINQTLISESKKTITLNKLLGDETVHSWHNNLDLLQSYAECFSTKNEDEAIQAYVAKCIEQNNYKNIRAISKIPKYTEPLTKITSIAYHELAQEDPVSFDKLIQATKIIPDQAETALAYDVCANKGNFESMQSIIEKTNLEPNEKNLVNLTDVLIEEEKWETLTSFIKKHTIPEDKIQLAYQKMIKAEKYTALKDLCALSKIELSKKTYNCFTTNIGGSK